MARSIKKFKRVCCVWDTTNYSEWKRRLSHKARTEEKLNIMLFLEKRRQYIELPTSWNDFEGDIDYLPFPIAKDYVTTKLAKVRNQDEMYTLIKRPKVIDRGRERSMWKK